MTDTPDILVLFAHLAIGRSKINRAMLDALADLPRVRVHDLLETYPDFYIDAAREQALLRAADLVVFQHPIYWHGLPAIMKHWLDVVLTRGFAFGPDSGALRGKALLLACSTGAPESAYREGGEHFASIADLLRPMQATSRFCGMTWLPPLVLHGGHGLPDDVVAAHARRYREFLAGYRHAPPADEAHGEG
jgi:glutathione-regulated potassium-efflux system ancillary protein KefF